MKKSLTLLAIFALTLTACNAGPVVEEPASDEGVTLDGEATEAIDEDVDEDADGTGGVDEVGDEDDDVDEVEVDDDEGEPETSSVTEVTVQGSEFKFTPSSLDLKTGEQVRLTYQNTGIAPHDLTIEELGIGTAVISGGETAVLEFTAPATGTYTIFCSVAGHRQAGMEGQIHVQ